jgi:hypothetical protein
MERAFASLWNERPDQTQAYQLERKLGELWLSINIRIVNVETGELMIEEPMWQIERCSGDLWLHYPDGWSLMTNIYGEHEAT